MQMAAEEATSKLNEQMTQAAADLRLMARVWGGLRTAAAEAGPAQMEANFTIRMTRMLAMEMVDNLQMGEAEETHAIECVWRECGARQVESRAQTPDGQQEGMVRRWRLAYIWWAWRAASDVTMDWTDARARQGARSVFHTAVANMQATSCTRVDTGGIRRRAALRWWLWLGGYGAEAELAIKERVKQRRAQLLAQQRGMRRWREYRPGGGTMRTGEAHRRALMAQGLQQGWHWDFGNSRGSREVWRRQGMRRRARAWRQRQFLSGTVADARGFYAVKEVLGVEWRGRGRWVKVQWQERDAKEWVQWGRLNTRCRKEAGELERKRKDRAERRAATHAARAAAVATARQRQVGWATLGAQRELLGMTREGDTQGWARGRRVLVEKGERARKRDGRGEVELRPAKRVPQSEGESEEEEAMEVVVLGGRRVALEKGERVRKREEGQGAREPKRIHMGSSGSDESDAGL